MELNIKQTNNEPWYFKAISKKDISLSVRKRYCALGLEKG